MTKQEIIDMIKGDFEKACDQMKRNPYKSKYYDRNCAVARILAYELDAIENTTDHISKVYTIDINKSIQLM